MNTNIICRNHCGRFHRVLDAVLHDVRCTGILSSMYPVCPVFRPVLARLLQFGHQSLHLRTFQPRFSIRLPEDRLPMSVHTAVARPTPQHHQNDGTAGYDCWTWKRLQHGRFRSIRQRSFGSIQLII
jgi:hypothetical protein